MLIIHLMLWSLGNCQSNDEDPNSGMSLIGFAVEGFNPCPDGFVWMEREIGRRPSEENYWSGTFRLRNYKNLSEARVYMTLDSPAVLTIVSFV